MAIECSCFNVENNSCFQSLTVIKCQVLSLSLSLIPSPATKRTVQTTSNNFFVRLGLLTSFPYNANDMIGDWHSVEFARSHRHQSRIVYKIINSILKLNFFSKPSDCHHFIIHGFIFFSYFIWMIVHIIWITIYPRFAIQLSYLFING